MSNRKNKVFIATSLDGYIADRNGEIDWLHSIPNPDQLDMGYAAFMTEVDALVMGRTTFETVCSFDLEWPYKQPVFVLSKSLKDVPPVYAGKAEVVKGSLKEILATIHAKGHHHLYIDGGQTIQSFLKEDLIDEMTITIIPYLLGGGTSLFSALPESLSFACVDTKIYLDQVVQNRFVRKR
ncbi:MAG: dihydrofolate reductase family protein [Cyclobacteriaceae bacterium]